MHRYGFILVIAVSLLVLAGCGQAPSAKQTADSRRKSAGEHRHGNGPGEHRHSPGGHGGQIVPIGREEYHAEVVLASGMLRLYILGKDESHVQDVELQDLTAYIDGEAGPVELVLKPKPQAGDGTGRTSLFEGPAPKAIAGKSITIPNLRIGADRFRVEIPPAETAHTGNPVGIEGDEARALYLTPGGKYTQADIAANGATTAAEKFKGIASSHNAKTKSGDRICPISETKANPKFSWVVGGERYEFCCPPCVDEFVRTAKERPEEIKAPSEYVKK